MKKLSLMLVALALVLGLSQCRKQETPVQAGEKQYIELTASNGNDGSKVDVNFLPSVMNLTWEAGDVITVSGGATGTLTLDGGAGTAQGHFSGEVTLDSRADLVFTWTKLEGEPDFNNQTGTEEWITDNLVLEAKAAYNESGKYNLKMEMPYAVLKLDLSKLVGESGNDVTVKDGTATVATVKNLLKAASGEVYVAMLTDGSEKTYTFSGNSKDGEKIWTLETNTFYTAEGGNAILIKPGYKFTVDSNGTTVEFAPGNLYYDPTTGWNFEANQWDFRTYQGKNSYINGIGSTNATPSGNWGMLGWSTPATNFGRHTRTSSGSCSGEFVDWGCNIINDDVVNTWRTLSDNEWKYLLGLDDPCRADASNLYAWKNFDDGIKGLVILPDDTENPSTILDGMTTTLDLAACGAVFLPAVGWRYGTGVYDIGTGGCYWTSSPNKDNEKFAFVFGFGSGGVEVYSNNRCDGLAIRMVR